MDVTKHCTIILTQSYRKTNTTYINFKIMKNGRTVAANQKLKLTKKIVL